MTKQQTTHWWLYDSHSISKRSPWLQTTLSELEHKTDAMLKLIQEDADSFAQRAEMYYKKRPQLISMVEEFYRIHRSLAERYDQVKSDTGTRLLTTLGSPFSSTKCQSEKAMSVVDLSFDSHSETCCDEPEESIPSLMLMILNRRMNPELMKKQKRMLSRISEDEVRKLKEAIARLEEENRTQKDELKQKDEEKREAMRQLSSAVDSLKEYSDSEVDDPEPEDEPRVDEETKENALSMFSEDEVRKLREAIARLEEENRTQKDELKQKDEEKREVIRQLSLAVDWLKEENVELRKKCFARESPNTSSPAGEPPNNSSPFEFNRFTGTFLRKLFNRSPRSHGTIVAL
nr:LOW QUALITY PROTEIN: protein NETWORKED 3C-like [Malus domestica]